MDAIDGEGPRRRPKKRLGRRLEAVAKAVGGGYRLQVPWKLAHCVKETAGIGVSRSRISQLAAEVKDKWKNGGKWGNLGNCGKLPKMRCGGCRKNV